ncbi:MAG: tetratricopeptide repeat protein [Spirochaetes bacterium]|nr:tetratricopeptide repeat protein [Spirochaetota bacterium]
MAEEQAKTEITYTPEELSTIHELTNFFQKAPGQVDLAGDEDAASPSATDDLADATEEGAGATAAPKRPVADLTKFDDVMNMDLDNFETPAADNTIQDVPLEDAPFAEDNPPVAIIDGTASAEAPAIDLDDLGGAATEPFPEAPAQDNVLDFELPGEPAAAATAAEPTMDFGDLDLPPATSDTPIAENDADAGAAMGVPDANTDFNFDAAPAVDAPIADFDAGFAPADVSAPTDFDAQPAFDAAPVAEEVSPDLGSDFNFDTPSAADLGDVATPDMGDFSAAAPAQDDAFNFDSSAPSLDDLSPEVALGVGGATTGAASLSSDLSSLAAEEAATVDPATLRRVRETLKAFPAPLRRRLSKALLDEEMKVADSNDLMRLLSEGASANEISAWLDSKHVEEIPEEAQEKESPRIIMARPEYTDEGLARQERLIKLTRFGAIAAFLAITLVGGVYFTLLKPYFYRQAVAKGRAMIMERGASATPDAERQFEKALGYYANDTYAYLQYADAYRYKGLYSDAFTKLFGEVKLPGAAAKVGEKEVRSSAELFGSLKRVPVVAYAGGEGTVAVNGTPLTLTKKGAYVVAHLDNKRDEALVLLALGSFHSNPSRRFAREFYKNNYLGADYYRRVLMARPAAPAFKKEEMLDRAVMGIGDIFYHEKDYDRSLDYYKKIVDKEPDNVTAHAGILKALIRLFQLNNDPRMVIQHHTLVRNKKLEAKLPMYIKARLAAFYTDLPAENELRVKYNISPANMLTGQQLKTRADELLTSIFNSSETDNFGVKHEGSRFAEGYYQRARSYAKDKNQVRMALKQFEYAFHYDPRHFMALNDRAELLTSLNDFSGAIELLKMAKSLSTPEKIAELGENEQDETLSEAPVGIIFFNMGKAMYLDAIRDLADSASWLRLKEVQKYRSQTDHGANALLAQLDRIEMEFNEARTLGVAGAKSEGELLYFSGWSKFVRNDHRGALADWEKIDPEKTGSLPNLSLAQSHCYYRLAVEEANPTQREKYLDSALGLLFYSQDRYAASLSTVTRIDAANEKHARLVSNLAIIENNIGAIYEMLDDEQKSLMHYWKSIENSKRIGKENEVANLNIRLSFKRKALGEGENYPVIMDFVPPQYID